jgi:hypothetical protein
MFYNFIIYKEKFHTKHLKPNTVLWRIFFGNVAGGSCFVKCPKQGTEKLHSQKSHNSDAQIIVPR